MATIFNSFGGGVKGEFVKIYEGGASSISPIDLTKYNYIYLELRAGGAINTGLMLEVNGDPMYAGAVVMYNGAPYGIAKMFYAASNYINSEPAIAGAGPSMIDIEITAVYGITNL